MSQLFWIIHRTYCRSTPSVQSNNILTICLEQQRHCFWKDMLILKLLNVFFKALNTLHCTVTEAEIQTKQFAWLDTTISNNKFRLREQKQYYVGIFLFILLHCSIMYKITIILVYKVTYNDIWYGYVLYWFCICLCICSHVTGGRHLCIWLVAAVV